MNECERETWLAGLKPGDRIQFQFSLGAREGLVDRLDGERIWFRWKPETVGVDATDRYSILSWVWRETGNCAPARTWIEPPDDGPAPVAGGDRHAG